jgi:hypothetical protein
MDGISSNTFVHIDEICYRILRLKMSEVQLTQGQQGHTIVTYVQQIYLLLHSAMHYIVFCRFQMVKQSSVGKGSLLRVVFVCTKIPLTWPGHCELCLK